MKFSLVAFFAATALAAPQGFGGGPGGPGGFSGRPSDLPTPTGSGLPFPSGTGFPGGFGGGHGAGKLVKAAGAGGGPELPTGAPSVLPSGRPGFPLPPSGAPSALPSGGPTGFPTGPGGPQPTGNFGGVYSQIGGQ